MHTPEAATTPNLVRSTVSRTVLAVALGIGTLGLTAGTAAAETPPAEPDAGWIMMPADPGPHGFPGGLTLPPGGDPEPKPGPVIAQPQPDPEPDPVPGGIDDLAQPTADPDPDPQPDLPLGDNPDGGCGITHGCPDPDPEPDLPLGDTPDDGCGITHPCPDDDTPGDDTPGDDTPGDDTPGDDTPGDDTPGDDTPGDDTPGDDTPGDDTPGDETVTPQGGADSLAFTGPAGIGMTAAAGAGIAGLGVLFRRGSRRLARRSR